MGHSLIQPSKYSGGLRSQQLFKEITKVSRQQHNQLVVASLPNTTLPKDFDCGFITRSPPLSLKLISKVEFAWAKCILFYLCSMDYWFHSCVSFYQVHLHLLTIIRPSGRWLLGAWTFIFICIACTFITSFWHLAGWFPWCSHYCYQIFIIFPNG